VHATKECIAVGSGLRDVISSKPGNEPSANLPLESNASSDGAGAWLEPPAVHRANVGIRSDRFILELDGEGGGTLLGVPLQWGSPR
jgi:hypothetical protein